MYVCYLDFPWVSFGGLIGSRLKTPRTNGGAFTIIVAVVQLQVQAGTPDSGALIRRMLGMVPYSLCAVAN